MSEHAQSLSSRRQRMRGARRQSQRPRRRWVFALIALLVVCAVIASSVWFVVHRNASSVSGDAPRSVLASVEVSGRVGATPTVKLSEPLQIVSKIGRAHV